MNLLYPMAFMMFYIFGLGILNFRIRNKALKDKSLSLSYFKTLQATEKTPEKIIRYGRHFDNQFQLPPFFFITCLTGLVLQMQTPALVVLAWVFILSRIVHSYFHLGSNHILYRAIAYMSGWIILLAMWITLFVPG